MVELASASGLSRVAADERDPLAASTFGTGLVLATAIGLGVRNVVLGLGGSATTDGGAASSPRWASGSSTMMASTSTRAVVARLLASRTRGPE